MELTALCNQYHFTLKQIRPIAPSQATPGNGTMGEMGSISGLARMEALFITAVAVSL